MSTRRGFILLVVLFATSWLMSVTCFAASQPDSAGLGPEITNPSIASDDGGSNDPDIQEDDKSPSSIKIPWNSGKTFLSNLTTDQKKRANSLVKHPVNESVRSETPPIAVPADLPESFDWRDNGGV